MKNQNSCRDGSSEPLRIDLLLSEDERRTSTIEKQIAFREAIASPARSLDPIDEECGFDDHLQIDPHITGTNNRRSDRELARILELIDNLEISDNGKEGQA